VGTGYEKEGKVKRLYWCNRCKECSVKVKKYVSEKGVTKRIEICLNKGHGFIKEIPELILRGE